MRNFIIDLRNIPSGSSAIGLHWQVAQATSLLNVVVEMSTANDTNHQGKNLRERDFVLFYIHRQGCSWRMEGGIFIETLECFLCLYSPAFSIISGGTMGGE